MGRGFHAINQCEHSCEILTLHSRSDLPGLGDWSEMQKPQNAPESARGGALQNRGALESACGGAVPVVFFHGPLLWHPREHSPEHPYFGKHPREHSWEQFRFFFSFPAGLPGQEDRYTRGICREKCLATNVGPFRATCPEERFFTANSTGGCTENSRRSSANLVHTPFLSKSNCLTHFVLVVLAQNDLHRIYFFSDFGTG